MAKKTEEIIRGAGMFQSLITLLVEKVKELGGRMEDLYRLITPEGAGTLLQICQLIVEAGQKAKKFFSLSLAEMIKRGKYDWVNSDITEGHFPVDAAGSESEEVEMKEFHFNRTMTSPEVIAEMAKEGWKPASIWHLLFFGYKYPNKQKEYPIIALGSVWRGCVAYLGWRGFRRDLDLGGFGLRWIANCRFLAVRK